MRRTIIIGLVLLFVLSFSLLVEAAINYYNPSGNVLQNWNRGAGTDYTQIVDSARQPSVPDTTTNVGSRGNDGHQSEFNFPNVTQSNVENITLWVYTMTELRSSYTFSLRQGTTTVCSALVPTNSASAWRSCTWSNPSGDLSDLRIHLGTVSHAGGGAPTNAYVYASYLSVDTGPDPPNVTLVSPGNNAVVGSVPVSFNFSVTDNTYSTIDECTLYANFTGTWGSVSSILDIQNGSTNNISWSPNDGIYIWNVLCENEFGRNSSAPNNYTVTINAVPPLIENAALNESSVLQNRSVRFNATITDSFGIDTALITLRYPNSSLQNITLDNNGNEYFVVLSNTLEPGIYNITLIWANDTLGQAGFNDSTGLYFEVLETQPNPFSLISPSDATESTNLTPTLQWEETSSAEFVNYTILIDKDSGFGSPQFVFGTYSISETSYELQSPLDEDSVYYWRVIAYDVFGNYRVSNQDFSYITDNTPPSVSLHSPAPNSYTTTPLTSLGFIPSDANTIDECFLYIGYNNSWDLVNSTTSVVKDEPNYLSTVLEEGYTEWNVLCTDMAGNSAFASQNRTIILDLTGPMVELISPEDESTISGTNIIAFTVNASDELASVDSCSLIINGSIQETKSDIVDGQPFNITRFLVNDYYSWSVNCTDTNGWLSASETRFLTVESLDNDPPVITLNRPSPNAYLQSGDVTFNYTVEDATGIENCSLILNGAIYDTDYGVDNFANNFFFATGLAEQLHNWSVACYDNSSELNYGVSSTRFFTVDLTDPVVSLESPVNGSLLNYSSVTFEYIPIDDNLASCALYSNFSGVFEQVAVNSSPVSGAPNYFYYVVPNGVFEWNVLCTDLSRRNSSAENNFTLSVDTMPPQYFNVSEDPESPASYAPSQDYYFSIEWTDNFQVDMVLFEHNFSGSLTSEPAFFEGEDVYSFNISDLPAGVYQYRWLANDTAGNYNYTMSFEYIIQKAESSISLYLNSSQDNITIEENSYVNITAFTETPLNGYLEVFINGDLVNAGVGILTNITLFEDPGVYNVTAIFYEEENYTFSSKTFFITVLDVTPPVVTLISPGDGSQSSTSVLFRYNVTDSSEIQSCSLYLNDTLQSTDTDIERNIQQEFSETLEEGDYTWRVECTDNATNTGISSNWSLTVLDVDGILVNVSAQKDSFERGEIVEVTTITTDIFDMPLQTNIYSAVITGNTSVPWWNSSWIKRRPLLLNETTGNDIDGGVAEINITGFGGSIESCSDELRIIRNHDSLLSETPFVVYSGDDSTWCYVAFNVSIPADAVEYDNYYVYYNNSGASAPGNQLNTLVSSLFYAGEAAADDGTPSGVANIIGFNDDTFATISVSGGGASTQSAHGRAFISSSNADILDVAVRYRYQVPTNTGSNTWQLRYSVNDGSSYTTGFSGTSTVSKSTSSWINLTSSYSSLTWSELNRTRLQGYVSKGGAAATLTMYLFWVEMNVTYILAPDVFEGSIGGEELLVASHSSISSIEGFLSWNWSTSSADYGYYSAVSLAKAIGYSDSSGYTLLEVTPDVTSPNITLLQPGDDSMIEKGLVNFTYAPFDVNLEACTLYIGKNGLLEPNTTHLNPDNDDVNMFENVEIGYGVYEWNVLCNDTEGNQAFADSNFTFTVIVPPPENFSVVLLDNRSVLISWDSIPEAESFNIYFAIDYLGGFSETPNITGITDNNFTDDASLLEKRFYKVTTIVEGVESGSFEHAGVYSSELYEGFNMASIPFILNNYELFNSTNNGFKFNLLPECLLSVWKYDSGTGLFERTDWVNDAFVPASGSEGFTSISTLEGYWLETNDSCSLMVAGIVPLSNVSINLNESFNLVPWLSPVEKTLPIDFEPPLINTQPSNSVRAINRFNASTQLFEVTIHYLISGNSWGWWPSFNNQHFTSLRPLEGYYFDSLEDSVWEHEP